MGNINQALLMKFQKTIGLIFFIISHIAVAQNDNIDTVKQQVLATQSSRFSAMINAETDELKKLLANELSYSHTTGWVETKSEFLLTIESKKVNYLSLIPRDINVRIYENTAVITGLVDVKLMFSGGLMEFTIRFLEVSRQMNSTWQLVAWQSVKNVNG